MLSYDQKIMRRCFSLAQKGRGKVAPNPMVGAVVVKNQKILATGYHHFFGGDHAEIDALKKLNFKAKGATLYCNLEPCFHQGKTPACVDAVIGAGIKKVVIANQDPNPKVKGQSMAKLKAHGIQIIQGVEKDLGLTLNRFFFYFIQNQKPYVIGKMAQSLDGRITPLGKKTGAVTRKPAHQDTHKLRSLVDAILVGADTVIHDDPLLTIRHLKTKHQPHRIIFDPEAKVSPKAKIFESNQNQCFWLTQLKHKNQLTKKAMPSTTVKGFALKKDKHFSLNKVLRYLADQNLSSVLVEGGARVFGSFVRENFFNEIHLYLRPGFIGKNSTPLAFDLPRIKDYEIETIKNLGLDVKLVLKPKI